MNELISNILIFLLYYLLLLFKYEKWSTIRNGGIFTGSVTLENDALYRRVEEGAHGLNGDAGEEPEEADVAVQRRLNFELGDGHGPEYRAVIHCRDSHELLWMNYEWINLNSLLPLTSMPKVASGARFGESKASKLPLLRLMVRLPRNSLLLKNTQTCHPIQFISILIHSKSSGNLVKKPWRIFKESHSSPKIIVINPQKSWKSWRILLESWKISKESLKNPQVSSKTLKNRTNL